MTNKNYDNLFKVIEKELNTIDPNLREWNLNYFSAHKNRYVSDLEIIERYYIEGEILEVGSVPCHLTYCLKKLGYPIIGSDLKPERVKSFIEKYNLTVVKCNIEKDELPFESNRFGLIIFNEVFEHLRIDPIFALKELNRVLKPGGIMILTTPNLYSLGKIVRFLLGQGFNDAYKEFEKLRTLGHMGHIREYSTKEAKEFLENTEFKVINVEYKVYNRTKTKIPFLDLAYRLIPKWRPFQIIISKKT